MLKNIEEYIPQNIKPILLKFPKNLSVAVKPYLSIGEEISLVNEVIENSYTYDPLEDREIFSPVLSKAAFKIAFIKYFTDIPMISKLTMVDDKEQEIVDSEKMYKIYNYLNLCDLKSEEYTSSFADYINNLETLVGEAIKFKNETVIAKSTVFASNKNEASNGIIRMLETINTILEKNGGKLIDKLTKSITKENLNKFISTIPNEPKKTEDVAVKGT